MSRSDFSQLEQELRSGKTRPVYLIIGADIHLKNSAMDEIIKNVQSHHDDASISRMDVSDIDAAVEECQLMPMWGGLKVVVIGTSATAKLSPSPALSTYLASPSPYAILIVLCEHMDMRTTLFKEFDRSGMVVECKGLYQRHIPEWIRHAFKRRGKTISQQAALFMADWLGTDLVQIDDSVEKILLYIGSRPLVDVADVEAILAPTGKKTIFDLTRAVGERDVAKALEYLHQLLDNHEEPHKILPMLTRHWRLLTKARELRHLSQEEVAKVLKVHPFFVNDYRSQAARFSTQELRFGFRALSDADRRLKSSRMPSTAVLRHTIREMIGMN